MYFAGVGVVDVIKDSGGNVVWTAGDNGRYLEFWFDSYIAEAINACTIGCTFAIPFSGGAATSTV